VIPSLSRSSILPVLARVGPIISASPHGVKARCFSVDVIEVVNPSAQTSESRIAMMAIAEVCWEDQSGTSHLAPAKIEDTSPSGVCIRINTPIAVGSKLTIRWQREVFSGVARNCRSDGVAFVMGIQRDSAGAGVQSNLQQSGNGFEQAASLASAELWWEDDHGTAHHAPARIESRVPSGTVLRLTTPIPVGSNLKVKWQKELFSAVATYCRWDGRAYLLGVQQDADRRRPVQASPPASNPVSSPVREVASLPPAKVEEPPVIQEAKRDSIPPPIVPPQPVAVRTAMVPAAKLYEPGNRSGSPSLADNSKPPAPDPVRPLELQIQGSSHREERKVMESKSLFPKFWRQQQDATDAPENAIPTEVPVNKINTVAPEVPTNEPHGELLSCEDIYHASGILSARSRYGINKIIEMLTSKHIRDMAKDVKRASVLMALDAAGTSVDEVLQDAARRQHALTAYEAGQQKQFDEFEARNVRENAQIQTEMERVAAHYTNRIKHNLDQVAQERAALCSWQAMKEQESQRIAEAVTLCGKQPIAEPSSDPLAALSAPRASAATM